MTGAPTLTALLACPSCGGRLSGMSCLACRIDFPTFDRVPWLMPDPRAALIEWRGRLHYLLTHYASEAMRHRAALATVDNEPGRHRLEHVAKSYDDQAGRIRELMTPLGLDRRTEAQAVHVALGTELPLTQGLSSYYTNLHRDWCWGIEENDASLREVQAVWPGEPRPATVLVLGAGACRLAYDLHRTRSPDLTVALDFNPLFLLAAQRILSGTPLAMYEFPIAPKSIADHAVLRELAAPAALAPGFELVLADASAPPFQPASFDVVVTPWFIDVAPEPVRELLPRINALLKPGGSWIQHGSLAFADADAGDALSLEELLLSLPAAGFSQVEPSEVQIPYLQSPASRHARFESVITFCARKERPVERPVAGRAVPNWLRRSDLPVPVLPQIRAQALSTRVYAFLLAMIDGERTIRDMARLMEQQKLMAAEDAEPSIRRFIARALEHSRENTRF